MISINNITKQYGDKIGNFNISFNINDGEVYSVVGPNSSGKTTLIRKILGFIKSDEGFVKINDKDPWFFREEIMKFTGYIAGEISLFSGLTGLEYLKMVSNLKKNIDWNFVNKLIKHFDIDVSQKIKKMSKGMKQKIAIIASIMHKPTFLVLDEPTSGLDPIMREKFIFIINILKKEFNTTIIICSHILEEIINVSDKVGFIKDGKLIDEVSLGDKDIKYLSQKFKDLYKSEDVF